MRICHISHIGHIGTISHTAYFARTLARLQPVRRKVLFSFHHPFLISLRFSYDQAKSNRSNGQQCRPITG